MRSRHIWLLVATFLGLVAVMLALFAADRADRPSLAQRSVKLDAENQPSGGLHDLATDGAVWPTVRLRPETLEELTRLFSTVFLSAVLYGIPQHHTARN